MHIRITQSIALSFRMIWVWLMAISVASCNPTTPGPKPPLYAPIAIDQAGSMAEFDFMAYPKDSHEKNVLMVGLRVKRYWSGWSQEQKFAYLDRLSVAQIKLKLNAAKDDKPAQFRFYSEFDKAIQIRPISGEGSADVRGRSWGHDGEYDYFYLADLSRDEGGKYKVKVEVIQPNLDMQGMQAEVFVAFRLFGGK